MTRRKRIRRIKREASLCLQLQNETPVNVHKIADELGLKVVVSNEMGEFSGILHRETKRIFINSQQSKTRQRFAIAHEIGHYLLHCDWIHIDKIFPQRIKI